MTCTDESPTEILDDAVKRAESVALAQFAYMPALSTYLRILADDLADRYPDDTNGGH